ncbi:MAG: DUF1870 family protein [Rhodococcus sp.]|nr:DUF1870 family protein [Rhodococcus sp. (in: high G+C Gram-positive bacteria)]
MTPAELRVVREHLGLTGDWIADHLQVSPRTVRHWEDGKYPIPDRIRIAIEQLEQTTADVVGAGVDAYRDIPDPATVPLITYRTDADYHTHHPEVSWPASWHRAVCARIADEVPGLTIDYWLPRAGSPECT